METFGDKLRSGLYALLVHLACIAALFLGLSWTKETRTVSVPGPIIEAELVGMTKATAASASRMKPPKPTAPPQKPSEPPTPVDPSDVKAEQQKREEKKRQEAIAEQQKQDTIERERVAALAAEKAEQQKKEQEERKRQEQILLEEKLKEQERKEREVQKKLAEAKAEREKAEKKLKLEKERLAQLADQKKEEQQKAERERLRQELEAEQAQTGSNGQDDSLLARYTGALQNAVTQNWNRPDNAPSGLICAVQIIQLPGGEVMKATVINPCNADQVTRNSIEQAVMKASPLPYQGYEKVFERDITFKFHYDG